MSRTLVWIGIIFVGLFFTAGFLIGNLLLNNNIPESVKVEIVTKNVNSCPDNFAWFIVNISSKIPQNIAELAISTDVPIDMNFKLWNQTTPSILEVFLYPNNTHIDQTVELKVEIGKTSDSAFLNVWDWEGSEQEQAFERLTPFINYFSQNKSEFKINSSTSWEISCNDAGLLVVEHYLFKSENWELELSWHVMLPPNDWIKVYLRPRSQITPIWGGMIESWNLSSNLVIETDPPEHVFRPQ